MVLIIWCIYSTILNSSYFKGTIGKQKMGLKIEKSNGGKLTIIESFFRFTIGFLMFGVAIGMLPIFLTRKKQGLHDLLLNTIVITGIRQLQVAEVGQP